LTKEQRKQVRNQKKKDQIKINIITIKNHKFDLNDKIKNFDKKTKKKNKKSKVERSNWKTSYTQIRTK